MRKLVLPALVLLCLQLNAQIDRYSPGKLIIIGGGAIPDTIYQLLAQSMGGYDKSLIVIPTATSDEEWIKKGEHLKRFRDRGFKNLQTIHTRDKAKADDPSLLKLMREASAVYFGGGDQSLLANAYAGTQLHQEMFNLLKRGGVIMGTSAGATIMGSVLIGGDHRKEPHKPVQFPQGLSFLDRTAIDQHVLARNRQFDLLPVMEADTTLFGLAIDESTAAVMEEGRISVAGKSYVLVYDRSDWAQQKTKWGRIYMPFMMISQGERYDLRERRIR